MDKVQKETVWKAFWERQRTARSPGVLSQEWNAIGRAQFDAWADFAADLPRDARVLDLATGYGKLPQILRAVRSDISVVGVDIAEPLPPGGEGVELIGGVSMEALPFDADAFDAVVSLFGFEYGDSGATAKEALRVLRDDGPIGLMVHRGDGLILVHNRKREEQLDWAIGENGLFEKTLALLPAEHGPAEDALAFAAGLAAEGQRRFGPGSVGWELPESVRRTLLLGPRGSREKLVDTLALIEEQAANERGRIASLAQACAAADDRATLLAGFTSAGRDLRKIEPVALPGEPAFADLLTL